MRKTASAALCALALALAACAGGDDASMDTTMMSDTGMMAPAPMAGDTMGAAAGGTLVADVDSVVAGAQSSGGLTSIPPAVAIPLIQRIEDALDATNVEPLDEIATDLESLREELGGDINAGDVSEILVRLGEKVTAYAPQAGAASGTLTTLGSALTTQGRALGGGQ